MYNGFAHLLSHEVVDPPIPATHRVQSPVAVPVHSAQFAKHTKQIHISIDNCSSNNYNQTFSTMIDVYKDR